MEWALFVPNRDNLHQLKIPWEKSDVIDQPERKRAIEKVFGEISFTRLYFGQEFCELAIPKKEDLMNAVKESQRSKMEFTLVTPYVTEKGLNKLEVLLKNLVRIKPYCEVVVNDWGVLSMLHKKYPTFSPVLGRLLNKVYRDPRISKNVSEENLNLFRKSSLAGSFMQDLLKEFKVSKIEVDNLIQGIDPKLPNWGYHVSMYIPYGCITTGRMCLFRSWGLRKSEKFKATDKACGRNCRDYWLEMKDKSNQIAKDNQDWRVMQKGNTVFYEQQEPFLISGLRKSCDLGVNRIIYQPEPI